MRSRMGAEEAFRQLGADSYLGLPLLAEDGTPLGLLAVLKNTPMQAAGLEREILRIAAVQAGAELGRRLDNAKGEPIGVVMVLYRRPPEANTFATSVLLLLDIRRFKEINDWFRRDAGVSAPPCLGATPASLNATSLPLSTDFPQADRHL